MGAAALALMGTVGLGATSAHASTAAKTKKPLVMHGFKCTVIATKHHRSVVGHAGDVVCGAKGNDVLRASGPGTVILIAGPGKDTLIGSSDPSAQDTLIGGTGSDTLEAGTGGSDQITAGTGSDTIDCGTSTTTQVTVTGADSGDTESPDCSNSNVTSADLEFQGTVNTTDGTTTMNITPTDTNDAAQAWLSANGSPTSVDISLAGASIEVDGGGSIAVGDQVEVSANVAGSSLVAVDVQAQPASFDS